MEKNIFEQLANNVFTNRKRKYNIRCDMNFNKLRTSVEDIIGSKLKNNKSYFSLLIDGHELFLGEVNYDISNIPIGQFSKFEMYFTEQLSEQLRWFVENCDKKLVEKFCNYMTEGNYHLRYIVKDDAAGQCLSFECSLRWDCTNPLFKLNYCYCGYSCFGPEWLDYWYDRKRYFAC